jgi:hypothetical protein
MVKKNLTFRGTSHTVLGNTGHHGDELQAALTVNCHIVTCTAAPYDNLKVLIFLIEDILLRMKRISHKETFWAGNDGFLHWVCEPNALAGSTAQEPKSKKLPGHT